MQSRLPGFLQAIALILALAFPVAVQTQTQTPAPELSPNGSSYTLHVNTRLVLTDVTVTDKDGNPVHNLDRSAFTILDNGKPQTIASFSEHTAAEQPPPAPQAAAGTYSNAFLNHPPPAFSVLLLDLTTIRITDQMLLAEQLSDFVAALPPTGNLAIYERTGDHVVLLQNFTSDHTLLHTAITRAIPRLQQPGSWNASDLDTLQQMIRLLRPYPGRKNLLWFTGGSNLALLADATQLSAYVDMRPLYDALETSRIAVYPVDARGLTTQSPTSMVQQQLMMSETAEATGGHAFFNNNGLKEIAARVVENGDDFYTLTYYPHEPKYDNKWHRVSVVLAANNQAYHLSYRRGYYNDASNTQPASGARTTLRADGASPRLQPDLLKPPIVFSATVEPAQDQSVASTASSGAGDGPPPPKKNQTAYTIHFKLPATGFLQQPGNGKPHITMGTGVLAVNNLGSNTAKQFQTVSIGIDPDSLRDHPEGYIGYEEQINLPKGDQFLYILVWDKASGRFGLIQAPVTVAKRKN